MADTRCRAHLPRTNCRRRAVDRIRLGSGVTPILCCRVCLDLIITAARKTHVAYVVIPGIEDQRTNAGPCLGCGEELAAHYDTENKMRGCTYATRHRKEPVNAVSAHRL